MRGSPALLALRAGATIELPAHGGSMWPLLATGDRLRVAPASADALRVDDIVVRVGPQGLVTHRVVATAPLRTRGDALFADDPFDDGDGAVVGRVVARRRAHRWMALDGWRARGFALLARAQRPLRALMAVR